MTTLEERKELGKATVDIISEAAGEDGFALEYLWMWARMSRTLDDIFDDDQVVAHIIQTSDTQACIVHRPMDSP